MLSGISVPSLLIILLIVVLLFGTKKLRNIGSDLGGALRNFRKASQEDNDADDKQTKVLQGHSHKEDD